MRSKRLMFSSQQVSRSSDPFSDSTSERSAASNTTPNPINSTLKPLWSGTKRRQTCQRSDGDDKVFRRTTRILQAAMVTGFYQVGFHPWWQNRLEHLSRTMGDIWEREVIAQHASGASQEEIVSAELPALIARKVDYLTLLLRCS